MNERVRAILQKLDSECKPIASMSDEELITTSHEVASALLISGFPAFCAAVVELVSRYEARLMA